MGSGLRRWPPASLEGAKQKSSVLVMGLCRVQCSRRRNLASTHIARSINPSKEGGNSSEYTSSWMRLVNPCKKHVPLHLFIPTAFRGQSLKLDWIIGDSPISLTQFRQHSRHLSSQNRPVEHLLQLLHEWIKWWTTQVFLIPHSRSPEHHSTRQQSYHESYHHFALLCREKWRLKGDIQRTFSQEWST